MGLVLLLARSPPALVAATACGARDVCACLPVTCHHCVLVCLSGWQRADSWGPPPWGACTEGQRHARRPCVYHRGVPCRTQLGVVSYHIGMPYCTVCISLPVSNLPYAVAYV